jgi:hypothetical protein
MISVSSTIKYLATFIDNNQELVETILGLVQHLLDRSNNPTTNQVVDAVSGILSNAIMKKSP